MNMDKALIDGLNQIRTGWRRLRVMQLNLSLFAIAVPAILLLTLITSLTLPLALIGLLLMHILMTLMILLVHKSPTDAHLLRVLDNHFPELENSAELLLEDHEGLLARIQREKIHERIKNLISQDQHKAVLTTINIKQSGGLLVSSVFVCALVMAFTVWSSGRSVESGASVTENTQTGPNEPLALLSASIIETPAAYTGLTRQVHEQLDPSIHEGSTLKWQLSFNEPESISSISAQFVNAEPLEFELNAEGQWVAERTLHQTSVYRLKVESMTTFDDKLNYVIDVKLDQRPEVTLITPSKHITRLTPDIEQRVADQIIQFTVTDDFGTDDARLFMTLAKGTGENVRFRDVEIDLKAKSSNAQNTLREYVYNLELMALEFAPGDELYFRIEAKDNRPGSPNIGRSGSYIFRWPDPEMQSSEELGSMMMRVMPDFFRSQRQIIIDTEKLIAEQPKLTELEFKNRSQDIAESQKVLRLRYGRFLGEEYESGVDSNISSMMQSIIEQQREKKAEQDEHAGESAEEHAAHIEQGEHGHEHSVTPEMNIQGIADVLAIYGHVHDIPEQSTLLDEQTKAHLRVALQAMWDSELGLRLSIPQESLPYEYKALEYIKKAQQSERIYLKRVGFEPPPLKEDKRLTGKLEGIEHRFAERDDKRSKRLAIFQNMIVDIHRNESLSQTTLQSLSEALDEHFERTDEYLLASAEIALLMEQPDCQPCQSRLADELLKLLPDPQKQLVRERALIDPLVEFVREQSEDTE